MPDKVKPITPDEVVETRRDTLPDEVLAAFNELIAQNFSEYAATFSQDEVVKLIVSKMGCSRQRVFDERWLNVEDIYRGSGWDVEYDKPGYNESYPTITFRRRKSS